MGAHKRYRQGQILKLITGEAITSHDELRRRLAEAFVSEGVRVPFPPHAVAAG